MSLISFGEDTYYDEDATAWAEARYTREANELKGRILELEDENKRLRETVKALSQEVSVYRKYADIQRKCTEANQSNSRTEMS